MFNFSTVVDVAIQILVALGARPFRMPRFIRLVRRAKRLTSRGVKFFFYSWCVKSGTAANVQPHARAVSQANCQPVDLTWSTRAIKRHRTCVASRRWLAGSIHPRVLARDATTKVFLPVERRFQMPSFGSLCCLPVHSPPLLLLWHLARALASLPAARTKFLPSHFPSRHWAAGVGISGLGIQPVLKIARPHCVPYPTHVRSDPHATHSSALTQVFKLCLPLFPPPLLQPLNSLSPPILNDVRRKNIPPQLRRRQGRHPVQICRPR